MDPFLMMMLMGASTALPYLFGGGSSPPGAPAPQYPDATLLNEFGDMTDWQNMLRSQMTADYYGGTASYNRIDAPYQEYTPEEMTFINTMMGEPSPWEPKKYGMEPITPSEQENIRAAMSAEKPTGRWEATYTGTKPAAQYMAAQNKVYGDSAAGFGNQMENYFKQRGMGSGDIVSGAKSELKQDYDQKAREIASKSSDIYMQTLGNLFGEVSDAGQQAAQLSGLSAQASQNWTNSMDQRYNQQMALWQQAQNGPANPWAQAAGTMLPYLGLSLFGGPTTPKTGTWV